MVWNGDHEIPVDQPSKLKEILCCRCNQSRRVENSKLFTKTGFSTIKCGNSKCGRTAVSDRWNCRCMIQWIKCPRHIHIASPPKKRLSKDAEDKKKRLAIYGTTKPRPKLKQRVLAKNKKAGDHEIPGRKIMSSRVRQQAKFYYGDHFHRMRLRVNNLAVST